ncbi:primosomal protein DnaI [Paraliobacillus ryukyuensis]|uniref:Replicative DNA helicase loader DnaI n=1 Tax=Paraliobacillus ryukyuensis TaxID=200904 RepID=A0A366ECF8_9BACI|nr:primosomal protein DnaI [Paraliobacillus ryukyuensis]RBO99419.1 replicative DNA helicase loader DnaI [Paraliobacillus ryukyuensis]
MESIQASLKKWMRENRSFQTIYSEMKQEILNDPDIQSLLEKHSLSNQAIDRQLMKLYEYHSQNKDCDNCKNGQGCANNVLPGYKPRIEINGQEVHLYYEKCKYTIQQESQQERAKLIKSLHMPKDILGASIQQLDDQDTNRHDAIRAVIAYASQLETGKAPEKGLYFYGPFGVGKTYFLGALANELADHNIASMLIYMPEFVREMKASLGNDSLQVKIEQFKNIPVLMIDDIGAESISAWFRDEILGSILQYRMMERLPVFFSSNYSLSQLEKHLAISSKGDIEELKAGRIIERIKQVSKQVPLFAENRRTE